MMELLTAAQMRAIEQAAIESGEVTGLELMERAGTGVVEAIFEEWPELEMVGQEGGAEGGAAPDPADPPRGILGKMKALVLCGPGNNGGDGFVVARLLRARGCEVEVFFFGEAASLPADARVNFDRWSEIGTVKPLQDDVFDGWPDETSGVHIVIDALFGTGLARPFLQCRHLSRRMNSCSELARTRDLFPRGVAVDIPSGLCADSGAWLGDDQPLDFAGLANLTVTFHSLKPGHFLADGPASCGKVVCTDIGLTAPSKLGSLSRNALIEMYNDNRPGRHIVSLVGGGGEPHLSAKQGPHKFSHGHALVLSGGHGRTGAARLAARGALRIGAGLVTLGSPRSAMFENAAQLTAIMLHQIDGAHGVSELLEDKRFNALCLGPGLGRGMDTQAVVIAALKARRATVLDADALTRFERDPQVLFDLLHEDCVLTPHGGEFAILFPDLAANLAARPQTGPAYSKVDATREAAARAGCVVLFKGADTVIADPTGRCSVNSAQYERAAPWLATAGAGDVLAGFITGLLARGLSPMAAAEVGAWLHVECARQYGPGLISEDLPEQLPAVLNRLEQGARRTGL
ncbi:NAD(P)H-hydrate dehydratase [Pseudophaeobacter arcticus]|uniref:NAD(P)H-hydrate dehydratase n=1 Tax=Pseudophaeobacter arcticus TaxID=385492 RepID=UPI002490C69D|nr:NAD(P)H-hydrate dehydratase [Pseudophaeobacter arcticus]